MKTKNTTRVSLTKNETMKIRIFTLVIAFASTMGVMAQAPDKMSYQAVVRGADDSLVVNAPVGMRITILQDSTGGASVFSETHVVSTNNNGLVSIEIGTGTSGTGNFSDIDWANGPHYIKTETDPSGGTNYSIVATSQLLSVPYALHARTADSLSVDIPWTATGDTIHTMKRVGIGIEKPNHLFQVKGFTGITLFSEANGFNTTGDNTGIRGFAWGSSFTNRGVEGYTLGNGNFNAGVSGSSQGHGGTGTLNAGISGYASNNSELNIGVRGFTDGDAQTNSGVEGHSTGSGSGTNRGVFGSASGSAADNLGGSFYATDLGMSNYTIGVRAQSVGLAGAHVGVYGIGGNEVLNNLDINAYYGVYGNATDISGSHSYNNGIYGYASGNTSMNVGVDGTAASSTGDNYGVAGYGYGQTTGKNYAVYGYTTKEGAENYAVFGEVTTTGTSAVNYSGYFKGAPVAAEDNIYVKGSANGVILTSPNAQCWQVKVDNSGSLTTVSVTCP